MRLRHKLNSTKQSNNNNNNNETKSKANNKRDSNTTIMKRVLPSIQKLDGLVWRLPMVGCRCNPHTHTQDT